MFYGSDNFSVGVGLSIASPSHHSARYMSDQTFHTPNFGDEEFDLPPIIPQQNEHPHHMQGNMQYSMGMHGVPDQQGQQHYTQMYLPEHMTPPMTIHQSNVTYGGSPPTYTTLSSPHAPPQSPVGGNPHLIHHQQTGARPQQMPPMIPPGSAPPGRSPTNSGSPANPETGSEDSDDSVPVSQMQAGIQKRPSPEPVPVINTVVTTAPAAPVKKPKPQKKKKKRDPNEPQKPVSAYALFFRDTQAAIKGQNPNASFGEVSKIVASMWDALDADHKNVYKKKTEAAKKEYLKALAAYRASLVSKGAPTDSADGSGMYPPNFNANMSSGQHYQSHSQQPQGQSFYTPSQTGQGTGKKTQQQSQQSSQQNQPPPQQQQSQVSASQSPQGGMPPPPPQSQHSPAQQSPQQQSPHHQPMMQQMSASHHIDSNQYGGMRPNQGGYMSNMGDSHQMNMSGMHHMTGHGQMVPSGPVMSHMGSDGHEHSQRQMCVRNGCNNMAITSPEWENEYCSSDCVVTHCRDVFTNWVSTNQQGNPNYGNGVK